MDMAHDDFRLLVCGGRTYGTRISKETGKEEVNQEEVDRLFRILDLVRRTIRRPLVVIEGEQRGADLLARRWAEENQIEVDPFPADWRKYGKAAGYIRNTQMLREGNPTAVLAFPGGKGTKMMVDIAHKSGIPTLVLT